MPRSYESRESDPRKVKVQLNVKVTWEYREHLVEVAQERGTTLNHLVNEALLTMYPMHRGFTA